jgi:prepilin-type N-terminal cleavage/methylation domain-containing protein/prepilin-type processing-associated H-X9-DG protein
MSTDLLKPAEHEKRHAKRGFTLIELLVVIAIIAILAAILFPVFARARENARRSACQSNLKQIGLGLLQYLQDYDEKSPGIWAGPNGGGGASDANNWKWMDAIYPYVKSTQIFDCPSKSNSIANYEFKNGTKWGSYAGNIAYWSATKYNPPQTAPFSHLHSDPTYFSLVSQAMFEAPATTLWVTDGGGDYDLQWGDSGSHPTIAAGSPRTYNNGRIVERHLETSSVLYCDGHVKSIKLDVMDRQVGNVKPIFTIQADPD